MATDESLDAFRHRVRAWFAEHVALTGGASDGESTDAVDVARRFQGALFDAGLAGLTWPVEYGGQGLTTAHQLAFNEEAEPYVVPTMPLLIGLGMCAPTLQELGTQAQRDRHLARMLRGDEVWCQLFSEPGAGSDVASLRTRAVRDGDDWVVNGQKVWTSGAQYSDFGLLLARTNPDVPKHLGLTMFVLDMRAPGVTIRPLRQITGGSGFNEVFLDDVHVPGDAVVGDVDRGWQAAVTTLMNERVSIGAGGGGLGRRLGGGEFAALAELAGRRGGLADPVLRQSLASVFVEERLLELLSQRIRADVKAGRTPGPQGSVAKLAGAQLARHAAEVGLELIGTAGTAWDPGDRDAERWTQALLGAPGNSIAGGTPEIMKNILGERVLGLPREPAVDRDVPFRELRVGGGRS
ncbi:acyl-CoA dehydrogenase family protein [Trujillonella endophytica]|uniref:Acyl-CoA dehydrogenase, N-terminal domain n=1 Tax=Trujillonella endophytica TaxID=673521 RepID=A0A1H8WMA2_9ACTN|nr:acyl-CoA dehydrogenase family protein [Trujillella endophytica]SEP28756.1 Acyl-CoA dehydrogenase, N-terminal domain [Trujillella endophytica]